MKVFSSFVLFLLSTTLIFPFYQSTVSHFSVPVRVYSLMWRYSHFSWVFSSFVPLLQSTTLSSFVFSQIPVHNSQFLSVFLFSLNVNHASQGCSVPLFLYLSPQPSHFPIISSNPLTKIFYLLSRFLFTVDIIRSS